MLAALGLVSVSWSGALMAGASERFRARPTVPLCWVVDRYGRLFNTYAAELDLASASLLAPDVGGTLLVSRLRVYDLAGLTDRVVADTLGRGDLRRLADYVFDQTRPTFIHVHGAFRRGIVDDLRLPREYLEIVPDEDYVRQDAVRELAALERLRTRRLDLRVVVSRESCGVALAPGSTRH